MFNQNGTDKHMTDWLVDVQYIDPLGRPATIRIRTNDMQGTGRMSENDALIMAMKSLMKKGVVPQIGDMQARRRFQVERNRKQADNAPACTFEQAVEAFRSKHRDSLGDMRIST